MTWAQQSFAHARLLSKVTSSGRLEVALLCLHYLTFLGLPVAALGPAQGILFFTLAQVRLLCSHMIMRSTLAIAAICQLCI